MLVAPSMLAADFGNMASEVKKHRKMGRGYRALRRYGRRVRA